MATLLDRRLPRTAYNSPVLVTLPSSDAPIEARALNLSEKGLFIGTDARCEVGSMLRVNMPIGETEVEISGRVAWCRPSAHHGAPAGLGVEFTDIDHGKLDELKSVIGSDREHAIRVRFDGLPTPIRARASVIGEQLSLHTELPFLRLGSVSDFALEGDANSHRGRIRRVSIEPGGSEDVPRLRIEVDVLGVGMDAESEPIPRVARGTDAPEQDNDDDRDDEQECRGGSEIHLPPAPPTWVEPKVEDSTERLVRPRRWLVASMVAAATGFVATFLLLRLGGGAMVPSPTAATLTLASYPEAEMPTLTVAMESPRLAAITSPAQNKAATVPADIKATTATPGGFTITDEGPLTTIRFKLAKGSTEGARDYVLADPIGVAVKLPSGSAAAARKVHHLEHRTIKKIWVRDQESGSQVRIFTKGSEAPTYSVVTLDDQLAVIIETR